MKEEQEVPKELTEELIIEKSENDFHAGMYRNDFLQASRWAKEQSDLYWQHKLSERDKEWERRLVEEARAAFSAGLGHHATLGNLHLVLPDFQEYISKLKEKYNIKESK